MSRRRHDEMNVQGSTIGKPFAFWAEVREEDAQKLRCPDCAYLLPSKHDVLEHRETRRVHAAVLAASACPEHQDGCPLRPL